MKHYQLNEKITIQDKKIADLLKARNYIISTTGLESWKSTYKEMCNIVRKDLNITNLISMQPFSLYNDIVSIVVYDYQAKDIGYVTAKIDFESNRLYIEED